MSRCTCEAAPGMRHSMDCPKYGEPSPIQQQLGQIEKDLDDLVVALADTVLVKPEELLQRAEALVMRERALIDLCHAVTMALEADPPRVKEALGSLEMVRLWSYPVKPP